MISTINDIASIVSPVPGLTQDDSFVSYCNPNNLSQNCDSSSVCHCPHLIEFELCKVYEFFIYDTKRISLIFTYISI